MIVAGFHRGMTFVQSDDRDQLLRSRSPCLHDESTQQNKRPACVIAPHRNKKELACVAE